MRGFAGQCSDKLPSADSHKKTTESEKEVERERQREIERQIEIARQVMREDFEFLRELAER